MSRHKELRALWDKDQQVWQGLERKRSALKGHTVDAALFEKELRTLVFLTGDDRFSQTLRAIQDLDLVDEDGRWRSQPQIHASSGSIICAGCSGTNSRRRKPESSLCVGGVRLHGNGCELRGRLALPGAPLEAPVRNGNLAGHFTPPEKFRDSRLGRDY